MKNKLLSIALMVVAAITIIAAPIVNDTTSDDFTTAPQTSSATTTTTTTTTTTASSSQGEVTEPTAAATTLPSSEPEQSLTSSETSAVTTTVTTAEKKEPESTVSTTTKVTTTTKATTTKATTTKATTTTPKATTTKKKTTTTKVTTTTKATTTTKVTTTTKATTTTAKKPIENNAPDGTPVKEHGQLSVKGADIVDQNGKKFQLLGISTHGVGWFPDSVSKSAFKVFRDDWGANAIRLAMYIEESWGGSEQLYLAQPQRNYELVTKGVDACLDLGMYVIVDWHILNPGDPNTHTKESKEFFAKIAKKYADEPNIIYEICNEPNGNVNWASVKKYAEEVIKEIRKYDSDAIIICGTPTWSQDIDKAEKNRLSDKNTVYALHFYANTHTDWLRNRVQSCYNKGLPILVSEFGTCDASGNTGYNPSQTKTWLSFLDKLNIGYFNWSFCNKGETAAILKGGVSHESFKAGTSQLTESGKLIRELYRKRAGLA